MDPEKIYSLFNIRPNSDISIEELKNRYKVLAMRMHPDKGGSDEQFNFLTICFKKIYHDLKAREINKQFNDLKLDSKNYLTSQQSNQYQSKSMNSSVKQRSSNTKHSSMDMLRDYANTSDTISDDESGDYGYDNGSFNETFNKVFDQNKFVDKTEARGYGHMMAASTKVREDIDISQNMKIKNLKSFHKEFEKNAKPPPKDMIVYKEPEALPSANKMKFAELGLTNIDDFTGENKSLRGLNYMDYKRAHETSRLVDPAYIKKRQEYRSVDALEAERESISYHMSPEDIAREAKNKRKAEASEAKRLRYLREQDTKITSRYDRTHAIMLEMKR